MKNIKKELERFEDELIENIINTPDLEILKEVEEDHGHPNYKADKFQEILNAVFKKIRRKKWKI